MHTASFRTVRGYTIVAALLDELAFWQGEDSSSPDYEVVGAIKPAMATVPNAMLLCASSPYARKGALWEVYHKYFGKDVPVLIWHAPTWRMNPVVPQHVIDGAFEKDPVAAQAEYGAEFRTDIESFVSREAVEASGLTPCYPVSLEISAIENNYGFEDWPVEKRRAQKFLHVLPKTKHQSGSVRWKISAH